VSIVWLAGVMHPHEAIWKLVLPLALLGVGNGFMWSPLSTTATRNLPLQQAGAGSGVYNTTRQIGAVLGSAAIAVLMQNRLAAHLPGFSNASANSTTGKLPPALHAGFSSAMAESMLLPAAVIVLGLVAALCFARPTNLRAAAPEAPTGEPVDVRG
jgi:hypothetical protein